MLEYIRSLPRTCNVDRPHDGTGTDRSATRDRAADDSEPVQAAGLARSARRTRVELSPSGPRHHGGERWPANRKRRVARSPTTPTLLPARFTPTPRSPGL